MLRMPAKYPVDRSSFAEIIEGKFLYVDKTDLVYELVTCDKILLPEPSATVRKEPADIYTGIIF